MYAGSGQNAVQACTKQLHNERFNHTTLHLCVQHGQIFTMMRLGDILHVKS